MTIESSTQNAICVTVATSRYTVQRDQLQHEGSGGEVASFVMITDGKTTTISGFGHLLETFIRTKQLSSYSGHNENVAVLSDDNYAQAKLKLMHFDQSFENMPYDASKLKCILLSFSDIQICIVYFINSFRDKKNEPDMH